MRPCGCIADPYVFGHTCDQYGPPWLSRSAARLAAIRTADEIRRDTLAARLAAIRGRHATTTTGETP